ncbi:MAG: hypothetical protein ACYSWU_28680 [Planctomycetota bacterium]
MGRGRDRSRCSGRDALDAPPEPAEGTPRTHDTVADLSVETVTQDLAQKGKGEEPGIHRSPLALRPCSDCGQMVSKQANTCPKCGRAFHESSFMVRFKGEQPVLVWPVIIVLALGFVVACLLSVYGAAKWLAPPGIAEESDQKIAATNFALAVSGFYLFSVVVCAFLGGAIARPKMARITGSLLGLCLGPLGIIAAFGMDKRPQCPQCYSRLDGLAKECPSCHARLIWKVEPTWF